MSLREVEWGPRACCAQTLRETKRAQRSVVARRGLPSQGGAAFGAGAMEAAEPEVDLVPSVSMKPVRKSKMLGRTKRRGKGKETPGVAAGGGAAGRPLETDEKPDRRKLCEEILKLDGSPSRLRRPEWDGIASAAQQDLTSRPGVMGDAYLSFGG